MGSRIRRTLDRARSPFTRSVGSVMFYTAIGQCVYLATGPLLGRLFTPQEFGLYGLFFTFAITAASLLFLNYDFAIPAAQDHDDARRLTVAAVLIAVVSAPLIGAVLALLCWRNIAGFGSLPAISGLLMAVLLLCHGAVQLIQNWAIRDDRAVLIGKASVTLNVSRGATQVLAGLVGANWGGLAAGEAAGRVANAVHLLRARGLPRGPWQYPLADLRSTLARYRQFPTLLLPAQMIDSTIGFIQTAGVAYFFGPVGAGLFFLMRRTVDLPVSFAFRSLSDIFYARQARDARTQPERVRPFFVRSVLYLLVVGALLAIPAMLVSPALFAVVFGEQWRQAGVLAAIMAPSAVVNLAVAPGARIFALSTRPQLRFWFSGFYFAGTLAAFLAVDRFSLDLVGATAALSIVAFLAYGVYFLTGYVASASLLPPAPRAPG
jgi:O-antigen/teichoic acid export membrane protein